MKNSKFNSHIPVEVLEEYAELLEITVDYLAAEFVIDGAIELECKFVPYLAD